MAQTPPPWAFRRVVVLAKRLLASLAALAPHHSNTRAPAHIRGLETHYRLVVGPERSEGQGHFAAALLARCAPPPIAPSAQPLYPAFCSGAAVARPGRSVHRSAPIARAAGVRGGRQRPPGFPTRRVIGRSRCAIRHSPF